MTKLKLFAETLKKGPRTIVDRYCNPERISTGLLAVLILSNGVPFKKIVLLPINPKNAFPGGMVG